MIRSKNNKKVFRKAQNKRINRTAMENPTQIKIKIIFILKDFTRTLMEYGKKDGN